MERQYPMDLENKQILLQQAKHLDSLREELKTRLDSTRLERYEPHKFQAEFHKSPHKIRLFLGGKRSGKTTAAFNECISYAKGHRPWDGSITRDPPSKILLAAQDFSNVFEQTIFPKLEYWLPKEDLLPGKKGTRFLQSGAISALHFKNGSILKFGSFEQDAQKYEGADWDFIAFDETPPRDIYLAAVRGLIDRGGRVCFSLTPAYMQSSWIYDDLYLQEGSDPRIFTVNCSTFDNPHLPREEILNFMKDLHDEEIDANIYGKFACLAGLIFPEYDQKIHRVDPKVWLEDRRDELEKLPKGMVVDPHDRKPFAIMWFFKTAQDHIVFMNEWPNEDFHKATTPTTIDRYCEIFKSVEEQIPGGPDSIVWRLMDPNFGPTYRIGSRGSLVDQFAEKGYYFDCRIDDSILEGHMAIRRRFAWNRNQELSTINCPSIYFFSNLINIHRSFVRYTWDLRGNESRRGQKERPLEKFKDFVDLVRYTCMKDLWHQDPAEMEQLQKVARKRIQTTRIG